MGLSALVRLRLGMIGLVSGLLVYSVVAAGAQPVPLEVHSGERLLIVAPHPDDEVIAAAGLAQRVLERGGSVWIALVTGGDGYVQAITRETGQSPPPPTACIAYGERRLSEARSAWWRIGGVRPHLKFLGFPDSGLKGLLYDHWLASSPECSKTTGACDPPYDEAVNPDVVYCGANLRQELIDILREAGPTTVVFPDPLDQHADHSASGLFTLLAIDEWTRREPSVRSGLPRLLAYLVHWFRWPVEPDGRGPLLDEQGPLHLPQDLPTRGFLRTSLFLSGIEMATKRDALALYKSQQKWMPAFLAGFARRTEPFTVFADKEVNAASRMANDPLGGTGTYSDQAGARGR